jgi:CheY-like chemotaxis protein
VINIPDDHTGNDLLYVILYRIDGSPMSELKILLVDDDKSIQDLYDKSLSDAVFTKRFAANGKEALAIYHAWHPDVIVLDILMPVMAGYSVLQEIRSKQDDKSTMIIMATASTDSQDIRDCVTLGIQGYIIKPFNPKDISNKIMYCIQRDGNLPR